MVSDKLKTKLNELLNGEMEAHHIYTQAAAWTSSHSFEGATKFFLAHAQEELGHMLKFFEFLDDLGAEITLHGHQRPLIKAEDIRELFVAVQDEERKVTRHIVEAIELARAENSFETDAFLQWFAREQHEEEKLCRKILDRIDLIGGGPNAKYFIDRELAELTKAG
ncbi:ferritin [Ancylobacter oerskovii]|uniref:Ferritin n=1 Tax=Ancylobacter oerskovii TaxID=459519 RepID=A0ABW4Z3A0_9HYPH|nr:ferritin-like domain-containing protein [Ancylobacter oerskovii]MBS7544723.1 ferritin [Ancylobacter oerskovii]